MVGMNVETRLDQIDKALYDILNRIDNLEKKPNYMKVQQMPSRDPKGNIKR